MKRRRKKSKKGLFISKITNLSTKNHLPFLILRYLSIRLSAACIISCLPLIHQRLNIECLPRKQKQRRALRKTFLIFIKSTVLHSILKKLKIKKKSSSTKKKKESKKQKKLIRYQFLQPFLRFLIVIIQLKTKTVFANKEILAFNNLFTKQFWFIQYKNSI